MMDNVDDGKNICDKEVSFSQNSFNKNWSVVRSNYKKLSRNYYGAGEHENAIFFDSVALSCGFVAAELDTENNNEIDQTSITAAIQYQEKSENALLDMITKQLSNVNIVESARDISNTKPASGNVDADVTEFFTKYNELPDEWNILQISQMSDEHIGYSTKKDRLTQECPLKLTLFRYNQSARLKNKAIGLMMELTEKGPASILSTAYHVYQELFKSYTANCALPTFAAFSAQLAAAQSKLVTDMSLWLGPWVTMFSGKIKGSDGVEFEKNIYAEIDNLCKENNEFTDEQYVLLCIVARRLDLLDSDRIKLAADYIAESHSQYTSITKLLAQLKKKFSSVNFVYYPCILIIEDVLDSMPWEMMNKSQEFTRFNSIYTLFDLYAKYKQQISDGYLKLDISSGNILINPDDDEKLAKMKYRMDKFYASWLPSWKRIVGKKPNDQEMQELLSNGDVFIYSGHGSSLQFIQEKKFLSTNVMLIFGCESNAMKQRGIVNDSSSPPFVFYSMKCPSSLGALSIITDVWTDVITVMVVSQWINSPQTVYVEMDTRNDLHNSEQIANALKKYKDKKEPSLPAIIAQVRNETVLSLRMSSAFILRGLPVYNRLVERQ